MSEKLKKIKNWLWNSSVNPARNIDDSLQVLSIPSALVAEAYEGMSGKGDGKFNFKDAMPKPWGTFGDTGTQKTLSSITHPNSSGGKKFLVDVVSDPLTWAGGAGILRNLGSKGVRSLGKGLKNVKQLSPMNKIGTFNMPHSPLNSGHKNSIVNKDSIAASKACDTFKAGYMNRSQFTPEYNQKEYDREKHEFYYNTERNKMRLIPTDDGEVQDRSGIEKWQLAPDRRSSRTVWSPEAGQNPQKTTRKGGDDVKSSRPGEKWERKPRPSKDAERGYEITPDGKKLAR